MRISGILRMSAHRFPLSRSIESTSRPPIPQAYTWAARYKPTPSRPLLDMSQGVPGTPPPKLFLDALSITSSDPQNCGYTPNAGEDVLRKAIVNEMKDSYGMEADLTMEDVAITAGCNLAFTAVIVTVAERGDEVILPVPWYFNNEMTLSMLGINTVTLQTSPAAGFQPSVEDCSKLITPRTKAIVLVTPNNPTGAIYPPSLIESFAVLAYTNKLALIIDETYRDFLSLDSLPPHNLFASRSTSTRPTDWSWRSTLIHLFSFSKSYCIPGHRLGLVIASPSLMPSLNKALDNIQICAPRPPQLALAPLLPALRPFVRANAITLQHRHELFASLLPKRWKIGSQGGYYAFVKHPFIGKSSEDVCKRLAEEGGVLCLPAGFFGPAAGIGARRTPTGPEHEEQRWVRFSVANVDDEKVQHVCERLEESEQQFGWNIDPE